jgi:hypothetical protein
MSTNASRIVVAAPMSFTGAVQHTMNLLWHDRPEWVKYAIGLWAIPMIVLMWWSAIFGWYFLFGLWVIPYRIARRGDRKAKRQAAMHREMMTAMKQPKIYR